MDGPEGGNGGMNVLKAKIGDVKGRIVFSGLVLTLLVHGFWE